MLMLQEDSYAPNMQLSRNKTRHFTVVDRMGLDLEHAGGEALQGEDRSALRHQQAQCNSPNLVEFKTCMDFKYFSCISRIPKRLTLQFKIFNQFPYLKIGFAKIYKFYCV